jgi:hypothetical protein
MAMHFPEFPVRLTLKVRLCILMVGFAACHIATGEACEPGHNVAPSSTYRQGANCTHITNSVRLGMEQHLQLSGKPATLCGANGPAAIVGEADLQRGEPAFSANASTARMDICQECLKRFRYEQLVRGHAPIRQI